MAVAGTVGKSSLILLIQEDRAEAASIRQSLAHYAGGPLRLQHVERLPTALARIAGGGVDTVLLDLSLGNGAESDRLDNFQKLRREAPRVPIVVWCSAEDEGVALRAMRAGAADYIIKERCGAGLGDVLRAAIALGRNPPERGDLKGPGARKTGAILSLLGAKGGVGTTTVALNVAAVLALRGKVILAEMRPGFGTLAQFLQPEGLNRNLSHLLQLEPAALGATELSACLWPCRSIAGLSVLFGPQAAGECGPIDPEYAKAILKTLAGMADHVVVDLPASLSDANRAIVENSGFLAVVTERDPVCVDSAKRIARAMESWHGAPRPIEMVILNRAALGNPMPLSEIDARLGRPVLAVIPPEPDLCLSAQNAHTPLVAYEPGSLMAGSLTALAEKLVSAR